jgi:predicted ATPase
MEGARFIEKLRLKNLLSFGSEGMELELKPLNVLIGPNGSGKSNLIEALSLLQAAPIDIAAAIRQGGGIGEWLWKGEKEPPLAEIEVDLRAHPSRETGVLRYQLHFTAVGPRLQILREILTDDRIAAKNGRDGYLERLASTTASLHLPQRLRSPQLAWEAIDISPEEAAIARVREPNIYPELTQAALQLRQMRLYREFNTGHFGALRVPQRVDLPEDFLLEDASNLWLVLNQLEFQGQKPQILAALQRFYELATDYIILIQGGRNQFFLREEGLSQPISATRLSDGTLRFLCLLAILLHPQLPPLICIEEPELGLHPDIVPTIAELLVEASQRTQLIVTTHSETLISALGDYPEAVVICERDERGTRLQRLEREPLQDWLAKYSLGRMWRMGQIGGNRY